jgi:hypothetical protein
MILDIFLAGVERNFLVLIDYTGKIRARPARLEPPAFGIITIKSYNWESFKRELMFRYITGIMSTTKWS